MFRFFHTYHPQTWDAMVRDGFIDTDSGIRCMQHVFLTEDEKFNSAMSENGPLRQLLRRYRLPFYFDRIQGGIFYDEGYTYDKSLIKSLKDEFGDLFWGFQMHEWASNYMSDWRRLKSIELVQKSEEEIRSKLFSEYGTTFPWVEAKSVKEYVGAKPPESLSEFINEIYKLYEDRSNAVDKELLPADSYFMAPKIELGAGSKRLMPEVGAQIANMRVQIAYTRGMARAAGVPWGVYYEPWGGNPFSTCSNEYGLNEWNLKSNGVWVFEMMGEKGGSSRALQNRIYKYAYWSGAGFISEEWGLCNTYIDWDNFELSQYGQVKKEFVEYTRKNPNRGEVIAPIAIVLPADMPVLDLYNFDDDSKYLSFPVEESKKETFAKIRACVNSFFGSMKNALGNEAHVIKNGGMPDAFDILHADSKEALKNYRYIIDLTGSNELAKEFDNIIDQNDAESALKSCLPCWVEGGAHWMVNKLPEGYLLTVMNHNGIERSVAKGELLLPGAELDISVCTDLNIAPVICDGVELRKNGSKIDFRLDGNKYVQFFLGR